MRVFAHMKEDMGGYEDMGGRIWEDMKGAHEGAQPAFSIFFQWLGVYLYVTGDYFSYRKRMRYQCGDSHDTHTHTHAHTHIHTHTHTARRRVFARTAGRPNYRQKDKPLTSFRPNRRQTQF